MKEFMEFRFDRLEESLGKTTDLANDAIKKADDAEKKAIEAHNYSQEIVKRAGWAGGIVATFIGGLFWVADHIPKLLMLFR